MTAADPNAINAEWGVLGAILNDPAALDAVRDDIIAADFAEAAHQNIFSTMCARRDAGEVIDVALVQLALGERDLGGVSVSDYLQKLYTSAPGTADAPSYARIIRHAASMRKVLEVSTAGVEAMKAPGIVNPAALASRMVSELDAVIAAGSPQGFRRISAGEASLQAMDAMRQQRAGKRQPGVPFGISDLDWKTSGAKPGQLIVIAGRPGMGKTTVGIAIALAAATAEYGVLFVSLEMIGQELAERMLACLAYDPRSQPALSYRRISVGRELRDDEVWRLEEAHERLRRLPFQIEQQSGLTVAQIAARARIAKTTMERAGTSLSLLVVDHLGLIAPSKRYSGNRVQEISEITGALKALAKELGVPVLCLSQLSRAIENRPMAERRPMLSDLRDSGSIEQDADVVLGLYREAYYLGRKPDRTPDEDFRLSECADFLEIEILKQRQGMTGRIDTFCSLECNVVSGRA